jgi:hypothetical protein
VVVVVDCSYEGEWGAEGYGVDGIFGAFTGGSGVDLFVVGWVFDVEFSGANSDDWACLGY